MIFLAECYANECFARELQQILRRDYEIPGSVVHRRAFGRDYIIKMIERYSEERREELIIAVIDYKVGIAREFVSSYFKLQKLSEGGEILLGVSRWRANALAIVFDPNIERAFICKVERELCADPRRYRRLKSNRACSMLRGVLESKKAKDILRRIARKLSEMFIR